MDTALSMAHAQLGRLTGGGARSLQEHAIGCLHATGGLAFLG